MYDRHYGNKYHEVKGLPVTVVAKRMREDIKLAVKSGTLHAGLKCSVKTWHGNVINIRVKGGIDWPIVDLQQYERHLVAGNNYSAPLNTRTQAVVDTLKNIHNAYNFDGSEIMVDYFDVNYYGDVKIDWEYRNQLEEQQADEMKAIEQRIKMYQASVA